MIRRLSSAHLLSVIAIVLALSGGAYAAATIGPDDIKRNAVRSKHLRDGSVARADLSASVRRALAARPGTGGRGPTGARGATGPRGPRGYRGYRGEKGATGATGPAGPFVDAVPAGRTLRGSYLVSDVAGAPAAEVEASVSFPFSLGAAPAPHFVAAGASTPAECPGSAASPAAAAGHLCVYEAERTGVALGAEVFDPSRTRAEGAGKAGRFGFGLRLTADAAGVLRSSGSWAATAPAS